MTLAVLPTLALVAKFTAGDQAIGDLVRKGFTTERGSDQPSLTGLIADAGTLKTTVENFDRAFDPSHTTSPYYPDVVPGVPISLTATWDSNDYSLFVGRAEGWPQTYGTAGLDQIVNLDAKDGVSELAQAQVIGRLPRQRTGERIAAALDAVNWPGTSSIDPGTALVPAFGRRGEPAGYAWALIAEACSAEWGCVWVTGDGVPFFLDRNGIADVADFTTPIAIFGDRPDLGELPYDDTEVPFDTSRIVNDATNNYDDHGSRAHAEDLASQDEPWRKRTWSQSIAMASGALARTYVQHVVHQYTEPTVRISRLRIKPQDAPDELWPIVLSLDAGQMFTVKKTPKGGGARIERNVFVRSVNHELIDGEWTTDVTFDDATLVTVDGHYGDGTLYGDPGTYSF